MHILTLALWEILPKNYYTVLDRNSEIHVSGSRKGMTPSYTIIPKSTFPDWGRSFCRHDSRWVSRVVIWSWGVVTGGIVGAVLGDQVERESIRVERGRKRKKVN